MVEDGPDTSDSDAERCTSEHGGLSGDGGAVGDALDSDGGLCDDLPGSSSDESCNEPAYGQAAFGAASREGIAECQPAIEVLDLAALNKARSEHKAFQTTAP